MSLGKIALVLFSGLVAPAASASALISDEAMPVPPSVVAQVKLLCADDQAEILDDQGRVLPAKLLSHEVAPGISMRLIVCMTGAYNLASLGFWSSGDRWAPFAIPDVRDEGLYATPYIFNPTYDARTRTLRTFVKYRGMGDCGSRGEYRIKSDATDFDRLLTYFDILYAENIWHKSSCEGKPFVAGATTLRYSRAGGRKPR